MDFSFSEEQLMLKDSVRKFAEGEIMPLIRQMEKDKRTPLELINKMKDMGYYAVQYPEEYGGAGSSYLEYIIMMEELARIYCSIAGHVSVNSMCAATIYNFGTEEQKKRFLPELLNGEAIGSFAFTEPATGSDPAAIRTTAVREGDEWVINGEKIFITNSTLPGYVVLFCRDVEKGGKITNIIVPKGIEGYSTSRIIEKMGMHGMEVADVVLQNVRVPYENTTGGEAMRGKGYSILLAVTPIGKLSLCGQCVGMAQAALETAVRYAKERVQRGKPIAAFQTIQWMIGEMSADVMAARSITMAVASALAAGRDITYDSARARLFTSQIAHRVASNAMQVLGAFSYTTEFPIERIFRDAKLTEIYEGVNEIQRIISASDLLR